MKEIETTFNKLKEGSSLGDYILLAKLVSETYYKDLFISKMFSKFISKEDYDAKDRPALLKHLCKLSSNVKTQ